MSMYILRLVFAVMLFTAFQSVGWAQESTTQPGTGQKSTVPAAQLRNNAKYYLAIYFDYKPGKAGAAFRMIDKYFIPVDEEAKRFVIQFRPITGKWDEIAFFPLKNGPDALAYAPTPSDAAWNAVFVGQMGSQERVDEIWRQFQSLVLKTKTQLIMRPAVYKSEQE